MAISKLRHSPLITALHKRNVIEQKPPRAIDSVLKIPVDHIALILLICGAARTRLRRNNVRRHFKMLQMKTH